MLRCVVVKFGVVSLRGDAASVEAGEADIEAAIAVD